MSTKTSLLLTIWVSITLSSAHANPSDYAVVVGKSCPIQSLKQNEVKDIYLGDKLFWEDGRRIYAARPGDDKLTEQFLNEKVGMTLMSYLTHWRRRMFSGRAIAPKKFDSSKDLTEYLNSETGAIGFIRKTDLDPTAPVRELKVD